ncbi:MAG: GDYXXLXY domain-containing protein [Oceanicaulis sp.]|nr:GDYXXLXY domain-containing protein [Oceanicaulis sp.]
MTRPMRLILIALAMTGVLIAMAGGHALQRATGTEIRLDMVPVDPRDLLLGHYATLETPLHRLDVTDLTDAPGRFARGDTIYVALRQDETGAWEAVSVHDRHPREGVAIRGKVLFSNSLRDAAAWGDESGVRESGARRHRVTIRYNLERYYASRDDALALEHMRDEARLRLIVSVNASGAAVIKGLEIDGEDRLDRLF